MFNEKLYEKTKDKIRWIANFLSDYGDNFNDLKTEQIETFDKEVN